MSDSKTLNIAPNLQLPLSAVTQTFAVLARKGSGKTYTASVMAEEMLAAGQPVVALDPTGAWWGLKSSADGKRDGFPVVVFGGDRADLPLNPMAGEIVARAIVAKRFPAVIDLSGLRKGETQKFVVGFLEEFFRTNREPVHLFVDEADDLCPQRPFGDEARMVGAVEDVVKRGRKKGIGCTLITQRPADLNKQVLTQCEVLFALSISHPKDIAPIEEWVRVHADDRQARQMIADLPSLPKGEAWIWSPSWLNEFKRVKVRKRLTFDSGATPEVGQLRSEPKKLAAVDVAALGEQMAGLAEEAKANDPKELKKKIAELLLQLREKPAAQVKVERVEVPTITPDQLAEALTLVAGLEKSANVAHEAAAKLTAAINAAVHQPKGHTPDSPAPVKSATPAAQIVKSRPAAAPVATSDPPEGERRVLTAVAQHTTGVTREQLSVLTGYKRSSRDTYLQRLKTRGFIRIESETAGRVIEATEVGINALGESFEPLPTGEALRKYWLARLPEGERKVLEVLVNAYPESVTRNEIDDATGYKRSSRDTYLQRLSSRKLVVAMARGEVKASDDLF